MNNSDDWGRDGDISMPNGPYGDEVVESKNWLVQGIDYGNLESMVFSHISQEELDDLREAFRKNIENAHKIWITPIISDENCTCGTDKVYGPTASARMHSEWCPKHGKVDG